MTMIHSPLEQFEVTPVWSLALGETLAFTNTAFFGLIVMRPGSVLLLSSVIITSVKE
jgi:hypothetical protein